MTFSIYSEQCSTQQNKTSSNEELKSQEILRVLDMNSEMINFQLPSRPAACGRWSLLLKMNHF